VNPVDGKAKQHNSNARLDEHVGNQVERLAKPPKLRKVSSHIQMRVGDVLYDYEHTFSPWGSSSAGITDACCPVP
jgi:hypothetical protein